jgi:8-oxo-dGTP pyrophosphatase MutT (NUDIX family)
MIMKLSKGETKNNPIKSFGIILCYRGKKDIKYLIMQMRNTYAYSCIVQGFYNYNNLGSYVSGLTNQERYYIINNSFDELWNDLWIHHNCRFFTKRRKYAYRKYCANIEKIKKYITVNRTNYVKRWMFPKGRKQDHESGEETALREFKEETTIDTDISKVIDRSFVHIYKGTDRRYYSTEYFVYESDNTFTIDKNKVSGRLRKYYISPETDDYTWLKIPHKSRFCKEASKYLDINKSSVLMDVHRCIQA